MQVTAEEQTKSERKRRGRKRRLIEYDPLPHKLVWNLFGEEWREKLRADVIAAVEQIRERLMAWSQTVENDIVRAYLLSAFEGKLLSLQYLTYDSQRPNKSQKSPLFYLYGLGTYLDIYCGDSEVVWLSGIVPLRVWKRLISDKAFRKRFVQLVEEMM